MIKLDLTSGLAAGITGIIAIYFFGSDWNIKSICFATITMTIFSITKTLITNRR